MTKGDGYCENCRYFRSGIDSFGVLGKGSNIDVCIQDPNGAIFIDSRIKDYVLDFGCRYYKKPYKLGPVE